MTLDELAVLPGYALPSELEGVIDERTLRIMEHRRRTAVVRRRGWLVRRALLLADLVGLLTALDVKRATFAGLSLGGMIAMELAATRPERPAPHPAGWRGRA